MGGRFPFPTTPMRHGFGGALTQAFMGEVIQGSFAAVRQLASDMSDLFYRAGIAQGIGKMFGGKRDLYAAFGYRQTKELTPEDLRARYERGEIAGTICEAWPDATWKAGAQVLETEDVDNNTSFELAYLSLDERLKLWSVFRRVDIIAQMNEYATLLIGAADRLDAPLPRMSGPEDVIYLQPYGADFMKIDTLDDNSRSARFGLPQTYRLKRVSTKAEVKSQKLATDRIVHWSRIIHVVDGQLDDPVYAASLRLRRVWNRIDDLDKVAGAGSEAFYRRAHQGTIFKADPKANFKEGELDAAKEQVDEYQHDLRRAMFLRAVEAQQLGSDVADFSNPVDCLLKLISAGARIPKRILEGSERGELASTADQENFDGRVADRRTQYAEPVVVRQFIDRLIGVGGLPTPVGDPKKPQGKRYFIKWPGNEKTPTEKADLALKYAQVNDKMKLDVIAPNEIRDLALDLDANPELEDLPVDRLSKKSEPAAAVPEEDPDSPDEEDEETEDEEDEESEDEDPGADE